MTDIVMTETAARPAPDPVPFTARQFRDAMGQFATGVVVISTELDGEIHAMTANAFMSGSLEPPLVLVSVARTARMHDRLAQAGRFGISVLTRPQLHVSNHFSGRPSAGYQPDFCRICEVPVIDGAAVQLAARVQHAYACGDHTLYVGLVQELQRPGEGEPLLYHGGRYAALDSSASGNGNH